MTCIHTFVQELCSQACLHWPGCIFKMQGLDAYLLLLLVVVVVRLVIINEHNQGDVSQAHDHRLIVLWCICAGYKLSARSQEKRRRTRAWLKRTRQ